MPFFERNSFVLRQLLHPGWVNSVNFSMTALIFRSSVEMQQRERLRNTRLVWLDAVTSSRRVQCYTATAGIEQNGSASYVMKLIGTPGSPYTRKVRVVLAEKRIDYDFVNDAPSAAATQVPKYNPLGKVPILVIDDETTVFDSRVIVEYLDQASPVSKLIPEDTRPRVQVRRWEALADGCTDAIAAIVAEKRRPADLQSVDWMARQQAKVDRTLKVMSHELGARSWCSGEFFNLSDIAVGCCLGFVGLRLPGLDWRGAYPNLAKLSDKLARRRSFKDTAPPAA
jgi:glutathione S-transferase